jgi:hypothetical protein
MDDQMYALRIQGMVERGGPDGNVLRATGSAMEAGAWLEAELILTGASTYQEFGSVRFGTQDHGIRYGTIGSGHLERAADGQPCRGGAVSRVDGGEGRHAGARGMVASLFGIDDAGRITIYLVAVVRGADWAGDAPDATSGGSPSDSVTKR